MKWHKLIPQTGVNYSWMCLPVLWPMRKRAWTPSLGTQCLDVYHTWANFSPGSSWNGVKRRRLVWTPLQGVGSSRIKKMGVKFCGFFGRGGKEQQQEKKKRLQTLGKWPRRNAILADKKKKEKVQENWRFFKETTMMALPKTIPKLAVILPFHMSLSDGGIDLQWRCEPYAA